MPFLEIVFYLFIAAAAVQLVFYLLFFSRFAFRKRPIPQSDLEPVSIVICAKNESENLLENIPRIMEQDYPNFEVVVVNDASWDDTADVLIAFKNKYPNFKPVTLNETETQYQGKKLALTLGIKGATNDWVVLTDADCLPKSNQWLKEQAVNFENGTDIVLGYGAMRKSKGLFNMLVRFDVFYVALQYFSFALWGMSYMGVGRNLAYRKSLFFKNKGFASHIDIASGDDDLFINEVATAKNTRIVASSESHTVSDPKPTFSDWFKQKRRHLTTGVRYKWRDKILLGMLSASQLGFYLLLVLLLATGFQIQLVLSVFLTRLLIQLITFHKSMDQLDERDLVYLFPVFDLVLTVLYPVIFISNLLFRQHSWKN